MNDNDMSKFTCKNCGGHHLIVTHVWSIPTGSDSERWKEWGALKENHHWQYVFKQEIEGNANEEFQGRDLDEYFVHCEECDREVEFGWSQPDRRGIILPVEFSDFMPSGSWPDPKYSNIWQQNGWLATMDSHPY